MDATEMMKQISEGASAEGMTMSEYLRENYNSKGLDDVQTVVNKGLSDNQGKIDEFRQSNNIRRDNIDFTGMDSLSLDLMQADVNAKMDAARADYTEILAICGIEKEKALV